MKKNFLLLLLSALLLSVPVSFIPADKTSTTGQQVLKYCSITASDTSIRGLSYTGFIVLTALPDSQSKYLPRLWRLWKKERWNRLEKLVNKKNLSGGYPPAAGFVNVETVTLNKETKLDRYGSLWGSFVAPEGTPFGERALPESSKNSTFYKFKVVKAIPGVLAGKAIPWFNEPGMGIQYKFDSSGTVSIKTLIENKYLIITDSVPPKPGN